MIDPYQNNAQSMQVGNLIIENQEDKISIYGDIDLCQNAQGLKDAKTLQTLINRIVQVLETQCLTTNHKPQSQTTLSLNTQQVTNPFL